MKKAKEEQLLKKFDKNKIPLVAFIELTNNCNLNCIHCLRARQPVFNLSKKLLKDLLSQLSSLGTLSITFTGGEPFLYKDLFESVSYARRKNFNVKISSNGTAIKRKDIYLLKSLAPITVQTSIYGFTAAVHDAITRARGSHQKTLGALKRLREAGINIKTNMIVMKQNFFQLQKVKEMALKEGWIFSSDFIIYPGDNGSTQPMRNRITDNQLKDAYRKGLIERKNFIANRETGGIINHRHDLATLSCRISACGDIFPSGTARIALGSLKEKTFSDIWFDSRLANKLRNLRESDFECVKCVNFRQCSWDKGLAFAEHGKITAAPNEWCRFVKKGG